MGYLDTPRIHIAGQFFTDPSTVNNDPRHYSSQVTRPSPWQEPRGNHYFQLRNCTVRSALDRNGQPAGGDAVIAAAVSSTDSPSPAKIVDLDVYQQSVSTIFGLQIQIKPRKSAGALVGTLDPPSLNSAWFKAVLPQRGWPDADGYGWGSHGGDADMCGAFQGVVRVAPASWPAGLSPVLDQMRAACATDAAGNLLLAMRFVLDGYNNIAGTDTFRLGRFVATLGPLFAGELPQATGPRWLKARPLDESADWYVPSFYDAPFKVNEDLLCVTIDLGNSICRQTPGGPPVDLGRVTAAVRPLDGPDVAIGSVDCSAFAYENNAMVAQLPLSDDQLALLRFSPLVITTSRTDIGDQLLFAEHSSGRYFSLDQRVLRLPGDVGATATTSVTATRWGLPAPGVRLGLVIVPVHGSTPGATVPPYNPGDTAEADGVLTPPTTFVSETDASGRATLTVEVLKDPGIRTDQLDGQLYFLRLYDPMLGPPQLSQPPPQEQTVSCLVWSHYPANPAAGWDEIQRLLQAYIKLYPGMTQRLDLSDLHTFRIFALNPPWSKGWPGTPTVYLPDPNDPGKQVPLSSGTIGFFMTRDLTDPRYMPVTRDMSPGRVLTILYFILKLQAEQLTPAPPPKKLAPPPRRTPNRQ